MKVKDLIIVPVLAAVLIASKEFNPIGWYNIELVTPLLISFSFILGWRKGVSIAFIFVLANFMIHPLFLVYVNTMILYIVIWPLIALLSGLFKDKLLKNRIYIGVFAVIMTLLFKFIDVTGYWIITGVNPIAYMGRSPLHYILHPISNYITCSILVPVVYARLNKVYGSFRSDIKNVKIQ